jgi:hypothetical protein
MIQEFERESEKFFTLYGLRRMGRGSLFFERKGGTHSLNNDLLRTMVVFLSHNHQLASVTQPVLFALPNSFSANSR